VLSALPCWLLLLQHRLLRTLMAGHARAGAAPADVTA
jgi:hypothetical protein